MPRTTIIASNFEMYSGNTRVLKVSVLDQDDAIVDLSGATATFVVMKEPGQTAIITKTIGSGIVVTNAAGGLLEITLDPADTEPLLNTYAYELKIVDVSGRATTVAFGTITIKINSA